MNSPYPWIANSLAPLRARLRRRFSPTRLLRRSDGLARVAEGGAGQEWIIARGLCACTLLDGAGIPAGKRRAFAETAVRRWSPFADPGFHVEWMGERALVWAWSLGRMLEAGEAPAAPPRRMLPESLFRGTPMDEGQALLAMDEGVEGRVWRGHVLAACEWWPQAPDAGEWARFLRGAGLPPAPVPALEQAPLAERPWSAAPTPQLGDFAARHGKLAGAVALGLGVAVLAALLASALSLVVSLGLVDREIAAQDEGLQRILQAREQAGRDADAIAGLLALRPPASQVELLAAVTGLLPGAGAELLEWRMPDATTLEVDLRLARPDPSALVQAWEASERFAGVTVELGRNPDEVRVKARIERPAAATGAAP